MAWALNLLGFCLFACAPSGISAHPHFSGWPILLSHQILKLNTHPLPLHPLCCLVLDQNCQLVRATWQGEKLESGEKSDRNGEPFYTTTLQMHYNALTLTSNSMTEQEYWFFDSDSSSNQSVQSRRCVWILLVMLASASSLHIQLLSSDSSVYFKSYIPTHHQDLHIHNQRAKQKQTTWNTTHPRWLQETKPTSKPHEILRKTQIGACSTEGKKKTIWKLHVEIVQIWFHMLYRCSSQFCKDLLRHILLSLLLGVGGMGGSPSIMYM